MTRHPRRQRRDQGQVLVLAVVVGAVSALPAAALALPTLSIVKAAAHGAGFAQAWQAAGWSDDEDLEMLPALLVGAILLAMLNAAVATFAWGFVTRRLGKSTRHTWIARAGAAFAAAVVPILLLALVNWPLALAAAVPAGLVALVAEPRLGYTARTVESTSS